jgi:lipid-A-disaccharide synthase
MHQSPGYQQRRDLAGGSGMPTNNGGGLAAVGQPDAGRQFRVDSAPPRLRIFFSAGEPSGDLHGANLIRAIRQVAPHAEFVGYGGPKMAAAGCQLHVDLTALAVMWFLRVLLNLHKFVNLVSLADRYFRHQKPDAVVLIDYPGFNWWIARRAKAHGIPVFYYAPPQIWAWASWRVAKMRRFVDHVLCSLPFEEPWFRQRGCNATFVGHPFFDEVRQHKLDEQFLNRQRGKPGPLVVILPGSRTQEVVQNLHWQLKSAAIILSRLPDVRFAIASFKPHQAAIARRMVDHWGLPAEVFLRKTPELIALADCCLAVSGSVSLELLYYAKPTVILYHIRRYAYVVQSFFRKVKYITLVNLLAADKLYGDDLSPYDPAGPEAAVVPYPEYLTHEDKSEQMARHIIDWLTDHSGYERTVSQLIELKTKVGHAGASRNAATYIVDVLSRRPRPLPRPHFVPAVDPRTTADCPIATGRAA